ncbi:Ulp1 protease family, carboxy-terminal catalytic domain protein [Rhizoctonia solani AG-3 Rhs1AP]|uniref:Ulp1 protease family, carboxy-terminal catalytic domain protein n=2 Tax=Rhizoctonia solani AG-3 TaxID=1086053 RepID=A0A074RRB2_9AGAM|nr:Ulp1 protease family, carboxy-terminal catalytic domain protein [Rhizoctonia solani AG-3 Rhs1AP]KEP49606.1 Ulp1 protease family, carboxy-terminal catalytic domain protein [Rhizoctonia solani 123E]
MPPRHQEELDSEPPPGVGNPGNTWDESYWVRPSNPRIYPADDVPSVVEQRRKFLLELPDMVELLIPLDLLSVTEFLKWHFYPKPRQGILPSNVNFTKETCHPNPFAIVQALEKRPAVPPPGVVERLEKELGQAWFNGMTAIQDSNYVAYPLPFWCITFWRTCNYIYSVRSRWITVEGHLASYRHKDPETHVLIRELVDRIQLLLQQTAWNGRLCGYPTAGWEPGLVEAKPTGLAESSSSYRFNGSQGVILDYTPSFSQFFGKTWLNDVGINMMLHFLRQHVQRDSNLLPRVVIADLGFTQRLLLEFSDPPCQKSAHRLLPEYASLLTHLGRTEIYFIVNPGSDHWAVILIDVTKRTVSYGDSMRSRRPHHVAIAAAIRWGNHIFPSGTRFTKGSNLTGGDQTDGSSCGIASCTIISHQIGLDQLWTNAKADYWRLVWAERVIRLHVTASGSLLNSLQAETQEESLHTLSDHEVLALVEEFPWSSEETNSQSAGDLNARRLTLASILNSSNTEADTSEHRRLTSSLEAPLTQLQIGHCLNSESNVCPPSDSVAHLDDLDETQTETETETETETNFGTETELETDEASDYATHTPGSEESSMALDNKSSRILRHKVDEHGVLHLDDSDDDVIVNSNVSITRATSPMRNPGKHKRSTSNAELDITVVTKRPMVSRLKPYPEERSSGPSGISRAARLDRFNKEALTAGTLVITPIERAKLLRKLRDIDPDVRLDPEDPMARRVTCSKCKKTILLDIKRTGKYQRHFRACDGSKLRKNASALSRATSSTLKIDAFFSKKSAPSPLSNDDFVLSHAHPTATPTPSPPPSVLCAGLRAEHDTRLASLMQKGPLGGRTDVNILTKETYGSDVKFSELSFEQKQEIRATSSATAKWIVHYDPIPHVRHTKCAVRCNPDESELTPSNICIKCGDLFAIRAFQNALNKPETPQDKIKFVPHVLWNKNAAMVMGRYAGLSQLFEEATTKKSPLMVFVMKTLTGELKNADMAMGLMRALAIREDKIMRGKGPQNFKRDKAFVDFCNHALLKSPGTYRLLEMHFPVPSERHLRLLNSRAPPFPDGITAETVKRAIRWTKQIGYDGPLTLGCDDTQVLSRFSPFYDGKIRKWHLLGGIGDPIELDGGEDDEKLEEVIRQAVEENERATKVRLWCLQAISAPGTPVFVLAAKAIGASTKADDLLVFHNDLVHRLLDAGICLICYSCDGSATERKVANKFLETATNVTSKLIPDPRPHFPPYRISIHHFGPLLKPIAIIQDCKHAAKNARNSLFSGSRSMVLGNSVIHYSQVMVLSLGARSPWYLRDIFKLDRQEDSPAVRMFSSAGVKYTLDVAADLAAGKKFEPAQAATAASKGIPDPSTVLNHDDLVALACYLFVFGDGFDAFQNRSLPIFDRIVMARRLQHFLNIWKSSLQTLGYPEALHFITRDLYVIVNNLVDGLMALVYIHRDMLSSPNFPLALWNTSTEGNEHTFGLARQIKPDFTYADFRSMIAKLEVASQSAARDGNLDIDPKSRGVGYHHTLYSQRGIDLDAIACFPVDTLIARADEIALEEATAIFSRAARIPVTPQLCPPPPASRSNLNSENTVLNNEAPYIAPAINEWFDNEAYSLDSDAWDDPDVACDLDDKSPQLAAKLEELMLQAESRGCAPKELEDLIAAYSAAAIALEAEEDHLLYVLDYFGLTISHSFQYVSLLK